MGRFRIDFVTMTWSNVICVIIPNKEPIKGLTLIIIGYFGYNTRMTIHLLREWLWIRNRTRWSLDYRYGASEGGHVVDSVSRILQLQLDTARPRTRGLCAGTGGGGVC